MRASLAAVLAGLVLAIGLSAGVGAREDEDLRFHVESGRHLFEDETFGGKGRTCLTCHTRRTGTVSPVDARERFARDPDDPLFNADGSDDGNGNGVHRMLADATVLVRVPLADNVSLANDPYGALGGRPPRHPDDAQHAVARPGADARRTPAEPGGPGPGRRRRPCERHPRADRRRSWS